MEIWIEIKRAKSFCVVVECGVAMVKKNEIYCLLHLMINELMKNIIILKVPIKIEESFKDKEGIYVINMLK